MGWVGPFKFREYLEAVDKVMERPRPPRASGVYLVSASPWEKITRSQPFYIGKANILCGRIGDFVFSMLGFDGPIAKIKSRHWGGMKLRVSCYTWGTPLDYHIAWYAGICPACGEAALCEVLEPEANERRPKRCKLCDPLAVDHLLGITLYP
jgi:hypothetical protein